MADLIDRAAAVAAINAERDKFSARNTHHDTAVCAGMSEALRIVQHAPTIDAAPVVHARWIEKYSDYFIGGMPYHDDWLVCSACGRKETELNERDETKETLKYCHCGARMDADAPERGGRDWRDG